MKEILEDKTIIKVGVDPFLDANYLIEDYGVRTVGAFDISYLVQLAGCEVGALISMADRFLNFKWKENFRFHWQWEKPALSTAQIDYAANNALIALELFKLFSEKLQPMDPSEDQKTYVQCIVTKYCMEYLDKSFRKEHPELKDVIRHDPSVAIDVKMITSAEECKSWIQTLTS